MSQSKNNKDVKSKIILINFEPSEYTINTNGQVYSNITKQFLKPFKNPSGYLLVDIHHKKQSYYRQVHRLVAEAFIPNPKRLPTVNHIDGNKENNSVENLEWMSIKDNVRHAWRTGLAKPRYGTANPANKYSEEQIHAVCQYLECPIIYNYEIANKCGVDVTTIRDIKFRGKWKQIADLYNINHVRGGLQSYRKEIERLILKEKMDDDDILNRLHLPETARIHVKYIRLKLNCSLND